MKILMVTPYAPERDGIAAYAVQSVRRMRAAGHDVTVLSPRPSAAHAHASLRGWRGALNLRRHARGFDRVVIQYHPDVFFPVPATPRDRLSTAAALAVVWRQLGNVEVRVHETDYRWGHGVAPDAVAVRSMWRSAARISVHTDRERRDFIAAFGVPPERIDVVAHGGDFARHTTMDRAAARASLDLPAHDLIFLCIGFIQEHKGFDRAVNAFRMLGDVAGHGARLDIVGSLRLEEPAQLAYAARLRRLVESTAGAHLHASFANDELFDRWIVASDAVVLPYRHIWSSGVLERAALYGRPVIATRVGALADQARPGTVLVDDDAQLAAAMRDCAEAHGVRAGSGPLVVAPWPDTARQDRDAVMQEVRRRAALERENGDAAVGDDGSGPRSAHSNLAATAPLRRIPPLRLPPPASSRPAAAGVKRLIRKLTAWELTPIVEQLNALQAALIDAVERLPAASDTSVSEADDAAASTPPRSRH